MKYWRFDLYIVFAAFNWAMVFRDSQAWLLWILFALFWTLAAWSLRPWVPTEGGTDG